MASLQPGLRVGDAAHFRNLRAWCGRLFVNSGTVVDGGRIWPRNDWRSLTDPELALVTTADLESADALRIFNIPGRLHKEWWECAARQDWESERTGITFNQFGGELVDYLQFKRLPLPSFCAFEIVISAPEQASTRPEMAGLAAELPYQGSRAVINLSDQESALIVLNLGEKQLSGTLPGGSFYPRVRTFLSANPDYPLLRISLLPGEGVWLPPVPVAFDGDTRGRTEVDVQFVLRAG